MGSYSVDWHIRHLKGHPGWGPTLYIRHLMGQPLYSSANAGLWGPWRCQVCRDTDYLCHRSYGPIRVFSQEAMVMAPSPMCDSAVSPCFMAAWPSSTGISYHSLLPHIPSICLSTVNSSPRPGIAPQSLNYSSQPLCCLEYIWLPQGLSDFIPFRLPQISCFPLSLKCFSSDSDALMCELDRCFRSPTHQGQVQSY